jgi:hypothetical protein
MKMTPIKTWLAAWVSVLTITSALTALADQPAETTATKSEETYSGTVVAVDLKEHVLRVKGWAFSKKSFNLGEKCIYALLEKNPGEAADLHAGQKVTVSYQNVQGVLIAGRVTQEAMQIDGMVKALDQRKRTLDLHRSGSDKHLQIAIDCKVVLRQGKGGSLDDIKIGNHVTVTYETPGDTWVACQIAQTSIEFTGTLTAIDLEENTVKAKAMFESKKFHLADNCVIVSNGRTVGHLADLKLNQRLVFSYDEINGIDVVNRIAPESGASTETNEPGNRK